jgi:hypothetical protein
MFLALNCGISLNETLPSLHDALYTHPLVSTITVEHSEFQGFVTLDSSNTEVGTNGDLVNFATLQDS